MYRRGDRDQSGDARFRRREKDSHRTAHARAEYGGLSCTTILHERKSGFEILDLAAVGDVFELAARLADVSKIKAQRQDIRFGELAAEINQLLAILIRLHAVAENHRAMRVAPDWMMQYAAQRFAADVFECDFFLTHR